MKKILIILGAFLVILVGLAFVLPIVFKDDIKAAIDKEIAKNVNAQVFFDADDFSVSVFKNFPYMTASLKKFGVVGKDEFKGDTLAAIQSFEISFNLMSIISGDKMQIKEVMLDNPRILAQVNREGKANWDIFISAPKDSVATPQDTTKTTFNIAIEAWEIKNGFIQYEDRTMPMFMQARNLDHKGKGDFNQDVFDLDTKTTIKNLIFNYDNITYLANKSIEADMILNINMPKSTYTFKENYLTINDFKLGFDGFVALPDTNNIQMDVKFAAKESSFKTLLSLVPGIFTEDFKDIKSSGTIAFNGYAKGIYNTTQMPAFGLDVKVDKGMFQYPKLPTAVNNINLEAKIENKDGIIDNTSINLRSFHADLGKNPIDAKILLEGLKTSKIDANIVAKLNLADLIQMFPIEGLALQGLYSLDLKAKGIYDSLNFPQIAAQMSLQNGYIKSKDFPAPLEQVSLMANVNNSTGKMADTKIQVDNFKMLLDGEPFTANASLENLDDYTYDVKAKGSIDLTKITKIYPLEGMTLAGKILADIQTAGKMSYIEAQQYDKLPTSGTMSVSNFSYTSTDVPQGVKITNASVSFTPQEIAINNLNGFAGKSDMQITGSLSNYMAYIFKDQVIKGRMNFTSNKFDVNEWMSEEPASSTPTEEKMSVVEVPKNIDFTLATTINEVKYELMTLNNVKGNVIIKDGVIKFDNLKFNSLGGDFLTNGAYNAQDLKHPKFDFDLDIANVSVSEAYKTITTIKKLAPLAQHITGNFSTKFKLNGELGQDMSPLYQTLGGGGMVKLLNAVVKDAPVLNNLSALTKMNDLKEMALKDVLMQAEVKDGRINFKPFDVQAGPYKMNVQGGNGMDGSMAYLVKMNIPAGKMGQTANAALSSLTGQTLNSSGDIPLNINVGGNYDKPQLSLAKGSGNNAAKDAVKTKTEEVKTEVKENINQAKQEAEKKAKEEAEKAKLEAQKKAKEEADRLKKEAEKKAKDAFKNWGK